jgi:hypothetical protein
MPELHEAATKVKASLRLRDFGPESGSQPSARLWALKCKKSQELFTGEVTWAVG